MRALLAISVLLVFGGVTARADGPSASAQQTMTVSVEVVRPCAIDSHGGSASVNCAQQFASQTALQSNAPKPLVTESAQSTDSAVTVQF
jgi:hypothetical protein